MQWVSIRWVQCSKAYIVRLVAKFFITIRTAVSVPESSTVPLRKIHVSRGDGDLCGERLASLNPSSDTSELRITDYAARWATRILHQCHRPGNRKCVLQTFVKRHLVLRAGKFASYLVINTSISRGGAWTKFICPSL